MNNIYFNISKKVKCLGFVIDSRLSWDNHINEVIRRTNFSIRSLNHCNLYFPLAVRKKVAHALLISKLVYGIEIFSRTSSSNLNKLNVCFNNIIRYVFKLSRRNHVSFYFFNFLGCSFEN